MDGARRVADAPGVATVRGSPLIFISEHALEAAEAGHEHEEDGHHPQEAGVRTGQEPDKFIHEYAPADDQVARTEILGPTDVNHCIIENLEGAIKDTARYDYPTEK